MLKWLKWFYNDVWAIGCHSARTCWKYLHGKVRLRLQIYINSNDLKIYCPWILWQRSQISTFCKCRQRAMGRCLVFWGANQANRKIVLSEETVTEHEFPRKEKRRLCTEKHYTKKHNSGIFEFWFHVSYTQKNPRKTQHTRHHLYIYLNLNRLGVTGF